jgi:hypothetical protein
VVVVAAGAGATTTSHSERAAVRLRSLAWLGGLALLGASAGCRSKEVPAPAASVTLAEAPAPASLIAELSVGDPKQTWQRARLLGGNFAQALPSSLPVLLATSLSLPPSAAGNLDESVPMVGVLLSRKDAEEPDVVLGMHVVSGPELVASLTLGNGAKFRRVELAPRIVRLLPAPGAPEFNGALGVSGNYLLLATAVSALSDAGRFVAEGVAKRARTEPGLTLRAGQSVLTGALSRRLRDAWHAGRAALSARDRAERDSRGRAPDFADPQVLLAGVDNTIESWLGVLESSRELTLSVTPEADRLRAELALTPNPDGAAALLLRELVVGSSAPLLQLPSNTAAALLMRGDAQPSEGSPPGPGSSIAQLFGERLNAEQAKRLVKAIDAFASSRRGATVFGFVPAPAPALLIRCELRDAQAFNDAFAEVLSLAELPPVSGLVAATLGRPSLELSKSGSGARRARLRLRSTGHGSSMPVPKSLSLSWEAKDGIGYIVVSPDEALGVTPFSASTRLDSFEWLAHSQPGLAEATALSIFADTRLFAPGGPDDAKVLLSFAKRPDQIVVALDVASAALPAVARLFALDRSP